ncbi:protein DpdD [Paraburkholderia diazotrophica]|uniref:Uncharacterized protein n=1 Tax=Paraburkholderia diazotrophica TaxID=667676 RepID=A0A1H6R8M9_9BURK|nr:protein DpdD [Paraburkholderia diazotrophica]SEI52103.1 hypothetical protein SAMN05192539_1002148 [Paraburkholderia diazotrophica]
MMASQDWLTEFYGHGNQIRLERVLSDDRPYDEKIQGLLLPLILAARSGCWPLLLPVSRSGRLTFYAGENSRQALEELRRVLQAFLGSADVWPDFLIVNKADDAIEQAFLDHCPSGFIRIMLLEEAANTVERRDRVFDSLSRILGVYRQRPPLTSAARRPLGRILRDFFAACQIKAGVEALRFYKEIQSTDALSQRNLVSLEIQALWAGDRHSDIVNHPRLGNLLNGRVPTRLSVLLLHTVGALGFDLLFNFEVVSTTRVDELRLLSQKLSPIFNTPPRIEPNECFEHLWKYWAIGACLLGNRKYRSTLPSFVDAAWLNALERLAGLFEGQNGKDETNVERPNKEERIDARTFDDFRQLLERTLTAPIGELSDIWRGLESAPSEFKLQLRRFPRLFGVWSDLQKMQNATEGLGWIGWLERLSAPIVDTERLMRELQDDCADWPIASFSEPVLLNFLKKGSENYGTLRNSFPLLLDWLDERNIKCTSKLWLEILEVLALDDLINPLDVQFAGRLVQLVISETIDSNDQKRMIEALQVLWEKGGSVTAYPSMLDVVDLLLEKTSSNLEELGQLWHVLQQFSMAKWGRLDVGQRCITQSIATEIVGPEILKAFPPLRDDESGEISTAATNVCGGKLLAIYSLTEGAARRARDVLLRMFEGLMVEINHDHVATVGLLNLAQKAQYFIFVSASATHQAFYPVSKARKDIIYPKGKGTSSIVDAFVATISG